MTKHKCGKDAFVSITNRDIYESIQSLHNKNDDILLRIQQHDEKLKWHQKLLIGSYSLAALIIGWAVSLWQK